HGIELPEVDRVIGRCAVGDTRDDVVAGVDAGQGHTDTVVQGQAACTKHDVGAYRHAAVVHHGSSSSDAVHHEVGIKCDLEGGIAVVQRDVDVAVALEGHRVAITNRGAAPAIGGR